MSSPKESKDDVNFEFVFQTVKKNSDISLSSKSTQQCSSIAQIAKSYHS